MTVNEFSVQFHQMQSPLYGFAMKMTRDNGRADDLMQDTFARGLGSLASFREGTNLKAWLTTIMRNAFINDYRKAQTRKKYEDPLEDSICAKETYGINESVNSALGLKELENLVSELSATYREPFLLFYEGYRYHEIAEQLELPLGTVKSRIFTARTLLKAAVKQLHQIESESVGNFL